MTIGDSSRPSLSRHDLLERWFAYTRRLDGRRDDRRRVSWPAVSVALVAACLLPVATVAVAATAPAERSESAARKPVDQEPRTALEEVVPQPIYVAVQNSGKYVATGAIADSVVTIIDQSSRDIVARVDVGTGPHGVRASGDGRWIYATVTGDNAVAVIDTRTLELARRIPLDGELPFWVAVPGNP